jgi:hypothetical protein
MTFTARLHTRTARMIAVTAIAFTAACSDSLTAPTQSAETTRSNGLLSSVGGLVGGLVNGLIPAKALARNMAVSAPVSRSVTFTRQGGAIELAELGLRVDVPAGAIPRDTMTITVTAVPGKMVAYEFQPHGTKFLKPLVFRQDLSNTTWSNSLIKLLHGGYFKNASQLNHASGTALLNELLPAVTLNRHVTFKIDHFSGYMVSSGRHSADSDESAF